MSNSYRKHFTNEQLLNLNKEDHNELKDAELVVGVLGILTVGSIFLSLILFIALLIWFGKVTLFLFLTNVLFNVGGILLTRRYTVDFRDLLITKIDKLESKLGE